MSKTTRQQNQGMVSSIMNSSGLSAMAAATLPDEMVAIKMSDRLVRELMGLG